MAISDMEENKNKVVINLPSNAVKSGDEQSKQDESLKDELMKLIIDTKDEAIELKINGEQYRKIGIHDEWRQVDFNSDKAAYFSYQEKAAKEFIYRFNKCGILSDQVGMGKTIEAGMIISELAYRKELGSLLILVPNENMAEKWENELARKFGFRNYYKDLAFRVGKSDKVVSYEELPKIAAIKSVDDLYAVIFSAVDEIRNEKGKRFTDCIARCCKEVFPSVCTAAYLNKIKNEIKNALDENARVDGKEFKMKILKSAYSPLIKKLVCAVSKKLGFENEINEKNYNVSDSGTYYQLADMLLDVPISNISLANGIYDRLIDEDLIIHSISGEFSAVKAKKGKEFVDNINKRSKDNTRDSDKVEIITEFKKIARKIRRLYAILIVSKVVNHNGNEQFNLLDYCINEEYESDALRYCSVSVFAEKGYRFIDMLIDMSYKTLIVDEAHDYIKVSHKLKMREDISSIEDYDFRQREAKEFTDIDLSSASCGNYFVFPLYNDYYFVEKSCMYLKIKALSGRSYRKIFMTATPIKSDMIDFYLLYLLADNGDTSVFGRIRSIIKEEEVSAIASLIMGAMDNSRKRSLNYYTYEDIVVKYIYRCYKNAQNKTSGKFDDKIREIIEKTINEASVDIDAIKDVCVNSVRTQFQDTFTIRNYETGEKKEVDSISELVSSDEGIEQWQNMYSQIGIRSTRHQTFRLDEERLQMLKAVQRGKYRNLPVWSRRNGTIVYIHKKDNYFDLVVKEKLEQRGKIRSTVVYDEEAELKKQSVDIPKQKEIDGLSARLDAEIAEINSEDYTDKLKEVKIAEVRRRFDGCVDRIEYKYKPKETAMQVYNYINSCLSGKLDVADYYSTDVDYDEFKLHMVSKLMTNGLEIQDGAEEGKVKRIDGKVLLFTDQNTQKKVLSWLRNECDPSGKSMTSEEISSYEFRYKHVPLWYYNSLHDDDGKWEITTDIKALKEKRGNCLIVVEPNKYEEGVDLQASNTLINFDIKFCPLKMEQRIGRIDRVKLCDEQPQLDIISFTPLNDMSGFMVDFLANGLKMFSCWRGDTTGIVSMPLGDKPNSATFESAILAINDAYIALYDYDGSKFISACKRIQEIGKNFSNDNFRKINELLDNEKTIIDDLTYLHDSSGFINRITSNSESSGETCENGFIVFGHMGSLAENKAANDGLISRESISGHVNDLRELKRAVAEYYDFNISAAKRTMEAIEGAASANKDGGKIETTKFSAEQARYEALKNRCASLTAEYSSYKKSKLETMKETCLGMKKQDVDKCLNPILQRYKGRLTVYLDVLIDLFDRFCSDVKDKAEKMTRFISYLTIEEFKVMANDYE